MVDAHNVHGAFVGFLRSVGDVLSCGADMELGNFEVGVQVGRVVEDFETRLAMIRCLRLGYKVKAGLALEIKESNLISLSSRLRGC